MRVTRYAGALWTAAAAAALCAGLALASCAGAPAVQTAGGEPEDPAAALVEAGDAAYARGDNAAAIARYTQALEDYPGYRPVPTRYRRALAYLRQDDLDRAGDDLREALALDPDYAAARSALAHVTAGPAAYREYRAGVKAAAEKKTAAAIERFTTALTLAPGYWQAFLDRGIAYYEQRRYDETEADFLAALDSDPGNPVILANLGTVYQRLRGDNEKAAGYYAAALEANPAYERARAGLAASKAALAGAGDRERWVRDYLALIVDGTYYVSAAGSDDNDGLTERTAFRTLYHANARAAATDVKVITVIGALDAGSERGHVGNEYVFVQMLGSLDREIVVTGDPEAAGRRRAVLSASPGLGALLAASDANIRFQHIEIDGGLRAQWGARVTLGADVVVTGEVSVDEASALVQ